MARINPININCSGPGDLHFRHSYPVDVLGDGTFQAEIPPEHIDVIRGMALTKPFDNVTFKINKANKNVLQSAVLSAIEAVFQAYGDMQIVAETSTELIIFYRRVQDAAYVVDRHGIHPDDRQTTAGQWIGEFGPAERVGYSAGVSAHVVRKVTARWVGRNGRPGFHITHEEPEAETLQTFGAELNRFVKVGYPSTKFWSHLVEGERSAPAEKFTQGFMVHAYTDWHVMPYTEQAAQFFVTMMLKVCELSERMREYFGKDDKALLESIKATKALPKF